MRQRAIRLIRSGVIVAAVAMLVSCGGAASPATTPTSAPTTATTATTASAGTATSTPTGAPVSSPSAASPIAAASPGTAAVHDDDVSFTSGPDTLYGTFELPRPAPSGKLPAALIISGSGPTDRDGNDPQFPEMNTNLNFAHALAGDGVASFRYDKLGSGKTGLGSHANGQGLDFNLYLQEARDAYDWLASRPEVDPNRIIILGHSEGALFALVLAQQLQGTAHPPQSLVLASPLSQRYLDLLKTQIDAEVQAAVASGQLTSDQAKATTQELDQIITSVRQNGKFPATITSPALQSLFAPVNQPFLVQADEYDPAAVAAKLPPSLPALVLHGTKDTQVTGDEIDHLMQGFQQAGNKNVVRAEIPNADHIFQVITGTPNPVDDYANPNLPFSPDAVSRLAAFVHQFVAAG